MNTVSQRQLAYGCAIVLLTPLFDGCAASRGYDGSARLSDQFSLYEFYDNSRDWGPSYLVGPPHHHFGDEVRIDDSRSVP